MSSSTGDSGDLNPSLISSFFPASGGVPTMMGANPLQASVDKNTSAVNNLNSTLSKVGVSFGMPLGGERPPSAGGSAWGSALGGSGGYAASAPSGAPVSTMGAGSGYAASAPSGAPKPTMGGSTSSSAGGPSGGGGTGSGAGGPGGGAGGAGGGKSGPSTGMKVAAGIKAFNTFASAKTSKVLTMDQAAWQSINTSGVGPDGRTASAQQAVNMIYGGGGYALNATAANAGDAQKAAGILNYASGQAMWNSQGVANPAYLSAQSSMYSLAYANPYATQTQSAQALAQMYSPRSAMATLAYGYGSTVGAGGAKQTPAQIASSLVSRTFQGRSSVDPTTMAAAMGEGGSINANINALASQAGWSSDTVSQMENLITQSNTALNKGMSPQLLQTLIGKAANGDSMSQKMLANAGFGGTTIQDLKNLTSTSTQGTADDYTSFTNGLTATTGALTAATTAIQSLTAINKILATITGAAAGVSGISSGIAGLASGVSKSGGLSGAAGSLSGMSSGFADALPILGAPIVAAVGQGLAQKAANAAGPVNSAGYELSRTGIDTASDAAAGALLGSVAGPPGMIIGGVIGGGIGLVHGLMDWNNDSNAAAAANLANTSGPAAAVNGVTPSGITVGSISGFSGLGGGTATGAGLGAPPSGVTPALGAATAGSSTIAKVCSTAMAQVGKPYEYAATGPDKFDCSGLTQYCYKQAGISIPRTSEEQLKIGSPVDPKDAQPGDLLSPYPSHIMICVGNGHVVEAPHTGTKVRYRSYLPSEFQYCRRVVQGASAAGQNVAATGGNGATGANAQTASSSMNASVVGTGGMDSELSVLSSALAGPLALAFTDSIIGTDANGQPSPSSLTPLAGTLGAGLTGVALAGIPTGSTTPLGGKATDRYGHTYAVPSGPKPAGTSTSWTTQALGLLGMSASWAADIATIIKGESGGDPWSINLDDSNARAGHPSEGIMQTIPGTFKEYETAGHGDIWNPVDNIIAGVRYAVKNYKSLDDVPGVKAVKAGKPYVGYRAGAWDIPSDQTRDLHQGEMIVEAQTADTIRNAILKNSLYTSPQPTPGSAGVTLNFAQNSITVNIPNATPAAASAAANQFVTSVMHDPRVQKMAVGL